MFDGYQLYKIKLIDGTSLDYQEDFDTPQDRTLLNRFKKSTPDDVFNFGNVVKGSILVPKHAILYVASIGIAERSNLG